MLGCSADPSSRDDGASADCVRYHFTRLLPGSGVEASVAADGTIAALSEVAGAHWASVLSRDGRLLGFFALDPFAELVRAAAGSELVAAAADGRVRRYRADGSVRWTAQLEGHIVDLWPEPGGGAIVSRQVDGGAVSYLDAAGSVVRTLAVRSAPFVVRDGAGNVALTSRDLCQDEAPCGSGFDPNAAPKPTAVSAGGRETSAVVLLDAQARTTGGFLADVTDAAQVGPLFIRSAWLGPGAVVVQATAVATERMQTSVDVDPSSAVRLLDVDTDRAPDHLLGLAGRELSWVFAPTPLDDSERAHVLGLFAHPGGVVVDVNGDVYKTHHILQLSSQGLMTMRYDAPNDGIANDLRLAGVDDSGRIVLSGRFDGTRDFDPGADRDALTATPEARRYISVISACP